MNREAILEALTDARLKDEAVQALADADAWMVAHPGDFEVSMTMEAAVTVLEAWNQPLDVWPQADRDELIRQRGRKVE